MWLGDHNNRPCWKGKIFKAKNCTGTINRRHVPFSINECDVYAAYVYGSLFIVWM